MNLYDLVKIVSKEKLFHFLKTIFNEKKSLFYIDIFERLSNIVPIMDDEPLEIVIFEGYNIGSDKTYIIEGILRKKEIDKIPASYEELETFIYRYSFSFSQWNKVLSYKINDKTLKDFKAELILCLIIEELTEFGEDESVIAKEKTNIELALDEAEKDISEGRTYSLEELGYIDKRTEEEKEIQKKQMLKDVNYNMNQYYIYLK